MPSYATLKIMPIADAACSNWLQPLSHLFTVIHRQPPACEKQCNNRCTDHRNKATAKFDILLRQTEGLSRLIDDLRVLSLSDSGQLYLYRETRHLKKILTLSVDSFRDKLKQCGLEPVIKAEDIVCFVDEVRLRHMLS